MATTSSPQGVLLILELFEAILSQLSLSHLLQAQLVCRRWRDIITGSPTLQRKLFFQPITDFLQPELNPLLQSLFPAFFQTTQTPSRWDTNPVSDIQDLDWFKDTRKRLAVVRPEASWRRMFPVQPPAKIERLFTNAICCLGEENKQEATIAEHAQKDGATMGLIYDIMVTIFDENPDPAFFIRWYMFPAVPLEDPDPGSDRGGETFAVLPTWDDEPEAEELVKGLKGKISLHIAYSMHCWNSDDPKETGLKINEWDLSLRHIVAWKDEEGVW